MVDGPQPLTDSQWHIILHLLPVHRIRRHCLRQVLDAMRYTCRTGWQWRNLPTGFPPWLAVYYYGRRWQLRGRWQRLNEAVVLADRLATAWLTGFRWLAIDYEFTPCSHETWLLLANITLYLNRLSAG